MLRKWRQQRWQRKVEQAMPSPDHFAAMVRYFPVLAALDGDTRERLRRRSAEILAEKVFHGAAGFEPDESERLAVAMLAALPILSRGIDWYRGFHTFIIYPAGFFADTEETDEAGVVHRGRDLRAGEAWPHGPVVLSLEDIEASGQGEGFNVVVHELAHQIDQLNGDMDGFPPLHADMDPKAWSRVFTEAFDRINRQLDAGEEPAIDPYAAESPAEFFAVTSEYYFDAPQWLKQYEPAVFKLLRTFYEGGPSIPA